jgi:hypothetical protein
LKLKEIFKLGVLIDGDFKMCFLNVGGLKNKEGSFSLFMTITQNCIGILLTNSKTEKI